MMWMSSSVFLWSRWGWLCLFCHHVHGGVFIWWPLFLTHQTDPKTNRDWSFLSFSLSTDSLYVMAKTQRARGCECVSLMAPQVSESVSDVYCVVCVCVRALVPCVLVCEDGLPLADGALINTWALSSQHHGQVSPRKPSQDQAPGTCAQGEEEQTTHLLFNITQASQLIDRIRR